MPPAVFDEALRVRRANPALVALASAPWAFALACAAGAALGGSTGLGLLAVHLAAVGALALYHVLRRRPLASVVEQRVRVDGDALRLGDERVPRDRITRAHYLPTNAAGADMVRVERRGGLALEVLTDGRSQAEDLLSALGFGVGQRVVTFRVSSQRVPLGARAALWGAVLLVGLAAALWAPALALLPMVAAAALLALQALPTAADVGADGVLLRWCGTRRFLPASTIAYTERYTQGFGRNTRHGLRAYVSGGGAVELLCGPGALGEEEADALDARLQALQALPRAADLQAERAALAREGRPVDAWLRDLRALGAGAAAGFREAPPPPERVLRVLEAPDVPAAERAAAAVALSAAPDVPRERVRVAADAVADPRLRAALGAAAAGDDAALAPALEALEARDAEGRAG